MASKKPQGVYPELEKAVKKLLKEIMADKDASLTDKMRVVDRALKLETVKAKFDDASFGVGFDDEEEE